jgi:hypothetical protein
MKLVTGVSFSALQLTKQVEVGIDEQLAVLGKEVQHGFDVGLGNLVAGVGHGAVALGLALELSEELSLLRDLDDLVVDDAVGIGYLAEEGQQVGGDDVAVDGDGLVGLYQRWAGQSRPHRRCRRILLPCRPSSGSRHRP